jgi:hypothetical protein
MSPLELRKLHQFRGQTLKENVNLLLPEENLEERIVYSSKKGRVTLKAFCLSEYEGEVVLVRELGEPRVKMGPIKLGFRPQEVTSETRFRLFKNGGSKYTHLSGDRNLEMRMR